MWSLTFDLGLRNNLWTLIVQQKKLFGRTALSKTYSVQPLSGQCFEFSKQNSPDELLMATGVPGPLFDKACLSLNDNISLTEPCYIQNFLAEAFVWTCTMFKIYRYLLRCFCQQFLYGANRFIECRPELSEPKYTRNTRREIRVNCVRTDASMRLSWQVYASALK